MGQGTSLPVLGHHAGRLQLNLEVIHKAAHLSYEEFLNSITELNSVTNSFTDHRGKQLHFVVKKGTDQSILWKGSVRIRCMKLNSVNKKVESVRLLTLRQYVAMYKEITEQVSNLLPNQEQTLSKMPRDITASTIFDGVKDTVVETETDCECCICMERRSEIILPCSHEFCEICIDSWHLSHNTCPLCRNKVESSDDTWVLTEKPTSADYDSEVKGYLVGLADRKGT